MRVRTSCPICFGKLIESGASPDEVRKVRERKIRTVFTHERYAEVVCVEGHHFGVGTAEPAYALVFERALQRFVDGDLRDAVLDVYTALDMYMPTVSVRARYDSDPALTANDIPRLREELSFCTREAARALAAGLAVASVVSRNAPPKFNTKLSNLRNEAVHSGKYPSTADTEWAIFEVERLVTTIDDLLTAASPERDLPFYLAVQVVDFPKISAALAGHTTLSFSAVLSGVSRPRETAGDRMARYRTGELADILFY